MRVVRVAAGLTLAIGLVAGLVAYGATETHSLYQLLVMLGAATVVALWAYRVERPMLGRFLPILAVGILLLVQILRLPPLRQEGYALLAVGWAGLVLALLIGQGDRGRKRVLLFLVGLGLYEAFVGLVQSIGGWQAHATGTYINRNHFAGLLNMMIPLAIGALYATYPRKGSKLRSEGYAWAWIVILVSGFMGVAILLSLSRGGTLCLLAGVAFVAVLLSANRRRGAKSVSAWAATILIVTVVSLGLWIGIDALLLRFAEENPGTDRIAVYRSSLKLIADYPLGVGPGMYQWYFRPYQPAGPMCWFNNAHNDYLQIFSEWGVLLGVAFWGFVMWRMVGAVRTFMRQEDLWQQGIALGCAGAIFSIMLHSLVDFNLQIPVNAVIFCMILGIAERRQPADHAGPADYADEDADDADKYGFWVRAAVTVLLLATIWTAGKQVVALNIARTPEVPEIQKYQEALKWSPDEPTFHYQLGMVYRDDAGQFDLAKARKHLGRAVELNPHNGDYWRELSRCHEMDGDFAEAESAIRKALSLTPHQAADHWRLGNFYLRQDRASEAVENIRQTVALDARYQEPAALLLWKAGLLEENLERVWAAKPATILPILRFLISKDAPADLVIRQWERMIAAGQVPEVRTASFFLSYLLKQGRAEEARVQWALLNEKAGLRDQAFAEKENLVWNGGFDLPVGTGVFDWKIPGTEGYRASVDGALRIQFDGTHNVALGVHQTVVVEPGRKYRFSCEIQAEGLTTDQGIYWRVTDAGSGKVLAQTEQLRGTVERKQAQAEFQAESDRVVVSLRRNPSRKLDNKVKGVVRVDDVRVCDPRYLR